jgi:hypothetical protein
MDATRLGDGDAKLLVDDPDHHAILARRNWLIALALAGMTSAAGCNSIPRNADDSGAVEAGAAGDVGFAQMDSENNACNGCGTSSACGCT